MAGPGVVRGPAGGVLRWLHQSLTAEVALLIDPVLTAPLDVIIAWAWKAGADEFIPDVMVYDRSGTSGEDVRFLGTPELVVEILSSNRGDDLLRKMEKYALAGLPRCWIVDPRAETLTPYALDEGFFAPTAVHGRGDVAYLDLGVATVRVDLDALFA